MSEIQAADATPRLNLTLDVIYPSTSFTFCMGEY